MYLYLRSIIESRVRDDFVGTKTVEVVPSFSVYRRKFVQTNERGGGGGGQKMSEIQPK